MENKQESVVLVAIARQPLIMRHTNGSSYRRARGRVRSIASCNNLTPPPSGRLQE